MDCWFDYVNELLDRGNMNELCIASKDHTRWITSGDPFLMNKDEIRLIRSMINHTPIDTKIVYKTTEYTVITNDSLMMIGVNTVNDVYLFAAKTRQYVIAAMIVTQEKAENCRKEIEVMITHLVSQGQ